MSFDVDAAFLAFVGACDQKPMEAEILEVLIGELALPGLLPQPGRTPST